ncbi:MAG: hypothetical protein HDR30_01075 [Lachnospiraceae bacterium]|nr:hypothetical protein [Lachnospiraceae bacterium]
MEIKNFITRASTLNGCINVRPRSLSGMGIIANCDSIEENQMEYSNMTLDEKYKEIDALVKECKALMERYEQVYDIISKIAARKAGEKSGGADRIKIIEEKRSNIQGEIDMLDSKIIFFEKRDNECSKEDERLRRKNEEIKKRLKSGQMYIPFYGLSYLNETQKMRSNYKMAVNRNNVLRAEINNDRKAYDENKKRIDYLQHLMNELSAEMKALRGKYGEILEVLNTLNCLIASMGDFITAMGKTKSVLQYSFFEDINKAQTAIDQTLSRIDSYHDVFYQKLTGIYGKLDSDAYDKIVKLVG